MAKRKIKGPFEDPILNAFYQQTLAQASSTVGPANLYNWSTASLQNAEKKARRHQLAEITGKKKAAYKYQSVKELDAQIRRERQKNKRYGGENESTSGRPGIFSRILDVISRPNYAVAEGIRAATADAAQNDASFWSQISSFGKGAVAGVTGKRKTTFSDVLRQEFPENMKKSPVAGATLGFIGDVFLDPTTYLGLGLASKVGRIGKVTFKSKAMKDTLKAIGVADDDVIKVLTHEAYTAGRQTRAAARAARKTVDEAADYAAKIEGDKVLKDWIAKGADATTARSKSQIAKGNMQVQLRKMADDILEAPGSRNIAIKVGSGLGMKGVEIPLSRFAVSAAAAPFKGLGKWDPVSRATQKFVDNFSNSARIFPELQQMRLEHRSSGLARVHARGEYLTKTFTKFKKPERESMLADALAGNFNTGRKIIDYNGTEMDAAEFIHKRLRAVQNQFASDMIHYDLVLEPDDVNRFSKYAGLIFKKQGKDDKDWIINSLKESKIKDAGEALFIVESAMEQALARRTMLKAFGDTWGARAGTVADIAKKYNFRPKDLPVELRPYRNFKKLQTEGWRMVSGPTGKPVKELDGMLFDPDTAAGMERILGLLDNEREMAGMLQSINNLTGKWKFFVTVPNPGFHIRNSIGDMYVNMMDNVNPVAYTKAGQLIHNKKMFEAPGAGQASPLMMTPHESMMRSAATYKPLKGKYKQNWLKLRKPVKGTSGKPQAYLSPAELWAAYNRYGMRQNYTISEYGKAFDEKTLRGGIYQRVVKDPLVRFSEDREDYFRLAHFVHLVETNPSKATDLDSVFSFAAQRVRETHFDYTDFTKFEKQGMSNLIPFYKWTRKSLPLQTELLFTQPGRVAVIPKAMRAVSEAMGYDWESWNYLNTERVIPEWMRSTGFMPGNFAALPGLTGPQQYFNVASPFGDAANQWAAPVAAGSPQGVLKQLASQLNPAVKAPIEYVTNERLFTGAPIKPEGEYVPRGEQFKALADYLTEQTPISRIAGKAVQDEDTTPAAAWSWLLGISIQPNTEGRQLSELYRRRDNTRGRWKGTRAKYIKKHRLNENTRLG